MSSRASEKPDYSTYPSLDMPSARAAAQHLLDMSGEGEAVDIEKHHQIERFYNLEARLLDEERFDEWYALLADDLFYWMPLNQNLYRRDKRASIDPENMALFDESKADIAVRLGRISSRLVWTEDPPSRHTYIISNVEAFAGGAEGEFEVHSTFIQYRNRAERDEATLIGRRRDLLRVKGDGFEVVRRMIMLPQSVLQSKNLTSFF